MDKEAKIIAMAMALLTLLFVGLIVWAANAPSDPNNQVCPVVGNIAICPKGE